MMYSMIQNSDFILKTINGSSYLLPTGQDGLWHTLSIAGLNFSLYGENTFFSPALLPFATDTVFAFPDRTVLVLDGTPATAGNVRVLLHNKELIVKDASFFCIYCIPSKKALCRMFFSMSFGPSGISATASYPLGGIVFLKQDTSDFVEELSPDEQILSLTNRMITPSWTPALFEKNLFFAQKLDSLTSLCRLHCTPTNHAAEVMKEYVDEGIRENK